jgi:hypothetical protein
MAVAAAPPAGKAASGNGNGEPLDGEHSDEQGSEKTEAKGPPPVELEGKGQLSLVIGGKNPDKATAKMVGGKIDIPAGEYQPGDVVEAVVRIRCTKVAVIHKMNNATGDVNEVEREHQFKLMQMEKVA